MTKDTVSAKLMETTERVDKMTTKELTEQERKENYKSHNYGQVDDCIRCYDCEIGIWNGWRRFCPAYRD